MVELASPDSGAASPREGAMIGIVAALVIVLVFIAAAVITSHSGNSGQVKANSIESDGGSDGAAATPTTTSTTTTSTTTTTTTSTTVPTTPTTLPGPGDINAEPPGTTCAELARRGFEYPAVVTYWQAQGKPARMDVDGNGKPCETAYPPEVVTPYFGH